MTDYLQHMGVERGLAANTLSAYRRDLARYANHLARPGGSSPADITRHDVTAFVQALSDGSDGGSALGVRSAARTVVAVRGLHKFWALEGVTPPIPRAMSTRRCPAPRRGRVEAPLHRARPWPRQCASAKPFA